MNKLAGSYLFIVLTAVVFSGCASFNYRVAENYYEQYAYSKAIPKYEKVLRKDFIPDAAARLAESYRKTGNSLKAEIWYKRLVKSPDVKIEHKLHLAEVLMENGKYAEARNWFEDYLLLNSTDKQVKRMIQACDSIHMFFEDTSMYTISLMTINNEDESNFSPAFFKNGIVFLSDRPAPGKVRERSDWTGKEYLDLFFTYPTGNDTWKEPALLSGNINGRYDEGPAVFTPDYNAIYFTRTDYSGKIVEKNIKDISVLKLYYGIFSGTQWMLSAPVSFNSTEYSVGHPALSKDGKTLYFVSDMPWGYGGTDIYASQLDRNGKWSEPENLGNAVNSEGDEMFPFISADSVLYFASDGHIGLGGLDMFSSSWNGSRWTKPENLQYPMNSSKDDFGFIIDSTNTTGFFSTNRIKNTDKLFSFRKNPPVFSHRAYVYDKKTSKPLKSFTIGFSHADGKNTTLATGTNGIAEMPIANKTEYDLLVKTPGYYSEKIKVSTVGKRKSEVLVDSLKLEKIELNKAVVWKSIQFNKKETELTPKITRALDSLYTILEMNPELQIEISSHTDSRGSFTDNYNISHKRSDEIAFYLINKGIRAPRLISTGYGEGKLLNYCRDGVLCLEEDHIVNNRVEIKVIDLMK
ncbi:MAG: OmpA family protein [Bacteroidota bacterium]|nr:OmpA family protein [Bacteroidota bacterium]